MKNTIYIAARFLTQPITGVQRYGIELSKAIKKLENRYGYNFRFLAPKNIIHSEIAQELNVKVIGSLRGQLWDQISLLKFLKKNNNPLVINFSNTLPATYKNKIFTLHDIIYAKYSVSFFYKKYWELIIPIILKNSKFILTVSEFSRREIAEYYNIDVNKIFVIYNGVSERFKPRKVDNVEPYILGVSSIAYHKNFLKLIEAYSLLKDRSIKLYIVGSINNRIFGKESYKFLKYINNNKNIIFLNRVDDEKLIELYSNAICFVYPSLYEGFGIPPLEAQACGCPTLVSDIPVFKEIYKDSVLYFNPLDPYDIADKIEKLLNNASLRDYLINKSLKNVKEFTWENSAKQFFNIINLIKDEI
jgi:glycosyltransferase involved in cell wall biosynthesis